MKYIYIVNRFTLKEKTEAVIDRLRQASARLGRDYEIILNETMEEADQVLERFRASGCSEGADPARFGRPDSSESTDPARLGEPGCSEDAGYVITAIGGDGSIHQLANALAGTRHTMAFIPIGTGNDFYRSCAELMPDGTHEIDLIRVNDRWCINNACFGVDADIANNDTFIHNRFIPRPLRYHAGVLYYFLTFRKGRQLKVECGDRTFAREFTTVVAANSQYYGGGYKVSPDSRPGDGIMEVYLVDMLSKPKMASIILSMKKAGHLRHPALHMFRTRKLVLSCKEPFRANLDGEPLLSDRFELELVPKALRLEFNRAFCEAVRM